MLELENEAVRVEAVMLEASEPVRITLDRIRRIVVATEERWIVEQLNSFFDALSELEREEYEEVVARAWLLTGPPGR